ncbi:MAG TPA: VTT domain-containing protein [Gemmatimonadales bacterium]|nr:VTT domain-containing protein [Gemmatimonadales bacterium]
MDGFAAWLTELSPLTVYLIVGLSAFIENLFPPIPSDFLVAVGGFLGQRTAVSPIVVALVAWSGYMAGSSLLYLVARRYGRRFAGSRWGRRMLPPQAMMAIERGYLRFGMAGVFWGRFLPGFRSFLAPFWGLAGLPPLKGLLPMAVASALWYGGLAWLGLAIGEEWQVITRFLGNLNRTLGAVAVIVAVLLGYWVWRQRKGTAAPARLLGAVRMAMSPSAPGNARPDLAEVGAAQLLYELTRSDPALAFDERRALAEYFRTEWGLTELESGTEVDLPAVSDTGEVAQIVSDRYSVPQRRALAGQLLRLAQSQGTLNRHQERLMQRVVELLGLSSDDATFARAPLA